MALKFCCLCHMTDLMTLEKNEEMITLSKYLNVLYIKYNFLIYDGAKIVHLRLNLMQKTHFLVERNCHVPVH